MLVVDDHEIVSDEFNGVQVSSVLSTKVVPSRSNSKFLEPERRYYTLKFHMKHLEMITQTYLEHILENGKEIRRQTRQRRLYSNKSNAKLTVPGLKINWSHMCISIGLLLKLWPWSQTRSRRLLKICQHLAEVKIIMPELGKLVNDFTCFMVLQGVENQPCLLQWRIC